MHTGIGQQTTDVNQTAGNRAYAQHRMASYLTGVRCGALRLVQVIAAISLGAGVMDLTWIVCANALGLMCSYVLTPCISAKNMRHFLLVPSLLSNIALISLFMINDLSLFVLLTCVHMFLDACTLPAMGCIQHRLYPVQSRGRSIGTLRSIFMLCGLLSAVAISELISAVPDAAWLVLPVAGILGLLACRSYWQMCKAAEQLIISRQKESRNAAQECHSSPLRDRLFVGFLCCVSIAEIAHLMLWPLLPAYLSDFGIGMRGMSWFFVIVPGIGGVLGFSWWGKWIDKYGVLRVRSLAAVLYAVEPCILAFLPHLPQLYQIDAAMLIMIAAACRGLALGAVVLTWSLAPMNFSGPKNCAAYVGCNNFVTGIRCCLAPLCGVLLLNYFSMSVVLVVSAILLLSSALMLRYLAGPNSTDSVVLQSQVKLQASGLQLAAA